MQIHIYIYTQHHNDTINKQTQEDLFRKIYTSQFICKVQKGYSIGFTVRGNWRPNINCNILTPLLWPSALCLSHYPTLLNRRPWGSALCWMMAFFTAFYQQLLWAPTQSGALTPSAWCGFPYHISSITPSNL